MDEKNQVPLPEGPHPFSTILKQIEGLVALLGRQENRAIGEAPSWLEGELERLEQQFAQFRQQAEEKMPPLPELSDEKLKALLQSLPREQRDQIAQVIVQGRRLNKRIETVKKGLQQAEDEKRRQPSAIQEYDATQEWIALTDEQRKGSPMELLSDQQEKEPATPEEQARTLVERRKRFGRLGGRKNWRPL